MENLKAKDHVGDLDISVLDIGTTFDCVFIPIKL
jgi:hypothetical protein